MYVSVYNTLIITRKKQINKDTHNAVRQRKRMCHFGGGSSFVLRPRDTYGDR